MEKKRILIIDDEKDFRETLSELLEPLAEKIFLAANGKEGLSLIEKEFPEVILSDFMMPEINGLELLKILKEKKITTPVIWLTGRAGPELFRDAWRSGVFDFFEKPCNFDKLYESVEAALSSGREFNALRPPSFMSQDYFKEITVPVEKNLYLKLEKHCKERGISIGTYMNSFLDSNFGSKG